MAAELKKLGGAKVVLATAPNAKAMSDTIDGLAVGGKLLVVGAPFELMEVSVFPLLLARRGIQGWPSGTARDSQDTLEFSKFAGVRPMIEKYPLAKVNEAFARMESGKARVSGCTDDVSGNTVAEQLNRRGAGLLRPVSARYVVSDICHPIDDRSYFLCRRPAVRCRPFPAFAFFSTRSL